MVSKPAQNTNYNKLKALIDGGSRTELQCRKYFKYLDDSSQILAKGTHFGIKKSKSEYRGNSGDSDYILSVCQEKAGIRCIRAYIWEVKAAQCPLFIKETENRLGPSKYLVKAENQLLHYYHEYKNWPQFHKCFSVHPDNVHFGGIIIGCKRKKVEGNFVDESDRDRLYEKALGIREQYFYKPNDIKIFLWESILDQLSHDKYENEPKTSTERLKMKSLADNLDISESVEVTISS